MERLKKLLVLVMILCMIIGLSIPVHREENSTVFPEEIGAFLNNLENAMRQIIRNVNCTDVNLPVRKEYRRT